MKCWSSLCQVDGPSYKLLVKKEKAHEMDVNSVQWAPDVSSFPFLRSNRLNM